MRLPRPSSGVRQRGRRPIPAPRNRAWAAAALAVEDLPAAMEELQGKEVTVVFPIQESPICHLACIEDPDGNHVWLHQRKDGTFG